MQNHGAWGPQNQAPSPPPKHKKGCRRSLAKLGAWWIVILIAPKLLGSTTANDVLLVLLAFGVMFKGGHLLFRWGVRPVLSRAKRASPPARDVGSLLPQVIANSADPILAMHQESARVGGGTFLGFTSEGHWVSAEPQHAVLVLGPPRSGKTSGIIIPTVLAAIGPVVSTSTKPDVMEATLTLRRRRGPVWLFDPTGQEDLPEGATQLRWSPVKAARSWDGALLMARAMVAAAPATRGGKDESHWTERATALIAPLLHAAALEGRPMSDVVRWVMRSSLDLAGATLEKHGAETANDILVGIAMTHEKERSGIFSTAANVLAAYNSDGCRTIATDPNFDADEFVRSAATIYITAPADRQELTAPLVVGLLQEIRQATFARARDHSLLTSFSKKWPVIFALDECANIAPIHDLPAMVSEAGGQGLHVLACFQDLSQVRRRWGDAQADGFLSLFVNKAILPNIADSRTIESLSLAFGEYDRRMTSQSYGSSAGQGFSLNSGGSISIQRQRVLSPGEIANIPDGYVMFIKGVKWWLVAMTPYFTHNPWPAVSWAAYIEAADAVPEGQTESLVQRSRRSSLRFVDWKQWIHD